MTSLRIFFVGGVTSYRALFNWLSPWILVPTFCIAPLFQILLFVYIGRAARLESDSFYLVGNALQYAALPCVFAMSSTVADERFSQTLAMILVTPARRSALFLGRALPVIANGFAVSAFAFAVGAALLGVHIGAAAVAPLAVVIAVASFSCTGLGLITGALGLRVRETAVLSNVIFGLLLVLCGVNVPLDELPGWMSTLAQGLPLTHAIEAARRVAGGDALADVAGLLGAELLIGAVYVAAGFALLRLFEHEARRYATLERV